MPKMRKTRTKSSTSPTPKLHPHLSGHPRGSKKNIVVVHECTAGCRGTGVYSGFAEPEGVAVVCAGCAGSGQQKSTFLVFTARKRRAGIKTVWRIPEGEWFTPTGRLLAGGAVTYAEFLAGSLPT